MQVFAQRNIHEKLPKAVSFTSIHITLNFIVGIGVANVLTESSGNQLPTEVSAQPTE